MDKKEVTKKRPRRRNRGGVAPRQQPRAVKDTKVVKAKKVTADNIQKKIGGQGTNPLSAAYHQDSTNSSSMVVVSQDPTLDINVNISDRSIAYLSMGIVLRALKRGWFGQALGAYNNISPYFAFRYLIDVFTSSINGTIPAIQTAPLWLWELLHAMRPKTESFKTGRVAFKPAVYSSGEGLDVAFSLGTGPDSFVLYWGRPTAGTEINGFNPLIDPGAYSFENNGAESAQSLFAFYDNKGLSVRCADPGEKAAWEHDTSFFGMVYAEYGSSFFCPAGLANTCYSERQIPAPLLTKFAEYQLGETGWRGSHQYRKSAGTPCYIGPRLSEFQKVASMYNKASPIFKFYNFDEFVERLALTLVLALETQYNIVGGQQLEYKPCPLTFQEFNIMLRQILVPRFCNDMAQDMRVTSMQTGVLVSLLPLVVGPNGCSQTEITEQPLFPKFFAESIRATSRVEILLRDSINGKLLLDVLPVLVRPPEYAMPTNYTWTVGENTAPVFSTAPPASPETPINMIDASAVIGNDTYYLNLNGAQLSSIISNWNVWIKSLSCLTGLTVLGTERGITALNTNTYTQICRSIFEDPQVNANTPATVVKKVKPMKPGKKIFGTPLRRVSAVGGGPSGLDYFKDVGVQAMTSNSPVIAPLFKYLSKMTLPISWSIADILDGSQAFYQTNQIEPYSISMTNAYSTFVLNSDTSVAYPSAYEKHLSSAALDIRPFADMQKSEVEVELDTLAAEGRGGFLTSIAAALGAAIGGEGVGNVIRTIGDGIGI